ncbi:MAG: hypothetical protein WDA27_07590 [Actinomycetota bacterium]
MDESATADESAARARHMTPTRSHLRSVRMGVIGAAALAAFYAGVVGAASGSLDHLVRQTREDWYFLTPIIAGFGLQVGLMAELRRRRSMGRAVAAAGTTGAGSSAVGMIACCAHHIADLAPFAGATGAAAFLTDYRIAFMLGGIGANAVGVTVAAGRLRRIRH